MFDCRRLVFGIALCVVLCAPCVSPAAEAIDVKDPAEFFEKSVRPLLATRCLECHGAKDPESGLRLDARDNMFRGGDNGPVVVPGEPEKSPLITAIHYPEDGIQMPPEGKLSVQQIAVLTTWVKIGAPWPESTAPIRAALPEQTFEIKPEDRAFWSFQPVAAAPVPVVRNDLWPKRDTDRFILARLEAASLAPSTPADRRTLIRRATFDLTGLPPTPEELAAFLADDSPDAFTKVVERLLESPHYGERWARHWLDIARYGEDQAHTFQSRKYPQGFRYRDWLIQSFNRDLPYDDFIKQQIAADLLLDDNRLERLPALGFFALGPVYYGDRQKLDQYDDRIDTLTRGFLGLTVACARCHDHKYDPISTADYYSLVGVIASTEYVEEPLVSPEEVEAADKSLSEAEKKNKVKKYPFIHALKEGDKPVTMRVHIRGSAENLGQEAPRHFLSILSPAEPPPFQLGSGRLELAEAIASRNNPLTARVMVNRIWKHHFGEGLVRTASNFGNLGERPTHPELLDYLAARFMASGWSIKELHREMMLSAAYQQSSGYDAAKTVVDPENRLVWRMNRRRLEVEAWRDAMLAAAGTLDRTIGGPSSELSDASYRRRTMYGVVSRHRLDDLLRLFDFPDPNLTSDKRPETTVPQQQLFVLNSEFMINNAKALAAQLAAAGDDDSARIRAAFLRLYCREPTEREVQLALAYLAAGEVRAENGSDAESSEELTRWDRYAQVLLGANEFMYVD
ncbi:MAG: PSD1 and planctomycete cytochrome C domain-containing protein [Pirellulales bacterium]